MKKTISEKFVAAAFAAAVSVCGVAHASAPAPATGAKTVLVLQCGSDWCESGNDVRRVFDSADFRRALGPGVAFAVFDDRDVPTPEITAANEKCKNLRVVSRRFPAITCLTAAPHRFFAQIENIPFDVTAEGLAAQIAAAVAVKDAATNLFATAARTTDAAARAAAYGKAFALLVLQVGTFNEKALREGALAWTDEWNALAKLDADDRFGWRFRFLTGLGVDCVAKATKFRTSGDLAGGTNYIASLRRLPAAALTREQRQMIDIAEYALWRTDGTRAASNKALLRRALSLGRFTVWGQCALGYLLLSGEKIDRRVLAPAPVLRPRPAATAEPPPPFPLPALEREIAAWRAPFSERQKLALAQYAVLRRVGAAAWQTLAARPGARAFLDAFLSDRGWLEDFVWSGRCDNWAKALPALETLLFQDNGRWVGLSDGPGRRFATALALSCPAESEAWLTEILDAYRATALAKRLHRRALVQPVWQWREALNHIQSCSSPHGVNTYYGQYVGALPHQQRFLDTYVNVAHRHYANTCWIVPYRSYNCFGEDVQGTRYYESWLAAGERPLRWMTPDIGGVCGELSKFGSACGNAHGLPSSPVGQPQHCALTRRLVDGTWEINYSVDPGTGFRSLLPYGNTESYTYCEAHEGTFEGPREERLTADRCQELASVAESQSRPAGEIARHFADAVRAWPSHYIAWRAYSGWLVRAKRPLDEHRAFADACAAALAGWRQPLWDLLSVYFDRVSHERGADALTAELVRLMPAIRQSERKIQEEGFFDRALAHWTRTLRTNPAQMDRVTEAALASTRGTRDYFAQTVSWCTKAASRDEARLARVAELVGRYAGTGGGSKAVDFGNLLLAASQEGNAGLFRQTAALQRRFARPATVGAPYPTKDFGGTLVSGEAMLRTSSTSRRNVPGNYAFALDETPLAGNAFQTGRESAPWALAVLAGPCRIRGIRVVNAASDAARRSRQVPIEVQVSADGKAWTTVLSDPVCRTEYRVDPGAAGARASHVRVRRAPGVRNDVFHLTKILVYGDKLY